MPSPIYHILFEKNFDDIPARHRLTTDTVVVTDVERREAFVNEINNILSKKSKKKKSFNTTSHPSTDASSVSKRY